MTAKKLLLIACSAVSLCSCIKISRSETRLPMYIDETNAKKFSSIIKSGEILAEDSFGTHRLVVVKENPATVTNKLQLHLYDEQLLFRKFLLPGYKRKIQVASLADFGPDEIVFNPTNAANIYASSVTMTEKSCNIVNSVNNSAGLNFSLFKVAGKDTLIPNKYFTAIYIQHLPCPESEIFKISTGASHVSTNFAADTTHLNCLPKDCQSCQFLIGKIKGDPVWWPVKTDSIPVKKKDSTVKKDGNDFGDSLVIPFNYTCGKDFNFQLNLVSDPATGDGTIYIVNNLDKPLFKTDTVKIAGQTNIYKKTDSVTVKGQLVSVHIDSTVKKTDTTLYKKTAIVKSNAYHYTSSFDNIQFNYLNELKRLYPTMEESCARELIFLISNALFRHDTALIKMRYGFDSSAAPKPKEEKKKASSPGPVHQGTVSIIPQDAFIMEPVYSSSSQVSPKMLGIKLQLSGDYDSTANQVVFIADTTLSNKLTILNPSWVITKQNWNAAINNNNGVFDLKLKISTASLKDSLQNLQTGFITIKGDTVNPNSYQEIQLRSYNPNKPFWVELGTNFDLLDKLAANNIYGGIFMYKKDVAKFNRFKKPNISMIGGVYESQTVSSEQAQNFANFQYLDNRIVRSSVLNQPFLVHQDTGTVSKTISVNNLGVFISPQLRLTNGNADADGLHVFLALWIELVWQKSTTTFDYSKTAQVDSFGVTFPQAKTYSYKPTTLQGDFRSHYYGLGLPIYLKEGYYNLYLNSVIGYSNQPGLYANYNLTNFKDFATLIRPNQNGSIPWLPFYLFQFRLTEEKYGISFTGEIRGTVARNYKSFVTLALSKKFDLSKLLNF